MTAARWVVVEYEYPGGEVAPGLIAVEDMPTTMFVWRELSRHATREAAEAAFEDWF